MSNRARQYREEVSDCCYQQSQICWAFNEKKRLQKLYCLPESWYNQVSSTNHEKALIF